MTDWPKITARRTTNVSPWMQIIEREVEFAPGAKPELYHAVGQQDYTRRAHAGWTNSDRTAISPGPRALRVGIAGRPGGQGRSARGLLPARIAGGDRFSARSVHTLGSYAACTARLSNRIHSFFVETGPRSDRPATEVGIELKLVTPKELAALILAGEFVLQLHIGALLLAGMRGHLDLVTL